MEHICHDVNEDTSLEQTISCVPAINENPEKVASGSLLSEIAPSVDLPKTWVSVTPNFMRNLQMQKDNEKCLESQLQAPAISSEVDNGSSLKTLAFDCSGMQQVQNSLKRREYKSSSIKTGIQSKMQNLRKKFILENDTADVCEDF